MNGILKAVFIQTLCKVRSAFFCGITQRRVVILYRRFGDNVSVPSSRVKKSKMSNVSVPVFYDFLNLEDGTDTLSRNVGKGLPFDAA
jgi:hypothetical protein